MLAGCAAIDMEELKQLLCSVKAPNFEARHVPPTLFSMENTPFEEEEENSAGNTRSKEASIGKNGGGDNEWSNFLVDKHHLYLRFMQPHTSRLSQFLQRVLDGI